MMDTNVDFMKPRAAELSKHDDLFATFRDEYNSIQTWHELASRKGNGGAPVPAASHIKKSVISFAISFQIK